MEKIQQLINLSFYLTACRITYIKTDRESLQLKQRALKIQIKTKIWTKEAQSFHTLVNISIQQPCHCVKIVPIHVATELPANITK